MINGENGMEMQKRISAPGKIELVKRVSRTLVRLLAYINHRHDGDDAATATATATMMTTTTRKHSHMGHARGYVNHEST